MLWRRDLEAEIWMTIFIARVQLTATAPWLAIRPMKPISMPVR